MATLDGKQIKNTSITGGKLVNSTVTSTQVDNTVVAVGKTVALSSGVVTVSGTGDIILATTPLTATSAVNKTYVDSIASGLLVKASVRVATAAALPAYTKTGAGAGAYLEADANGALNDTGIDGLTDIAVGNRVLVKNGAAGADNGIYVVDSIGSAGSKWKFIRATDADNTPAGEVAAGMYCFVTEGTANGLKGWVQTTPDPITIDTTALAFSIYSQVSQLTVGTFNGTSTANGLSISGGQIVAHAADGTNPGMVSTTTQSFAGNKTFTGTIGASNLSGTNTGDITIGTLGTGTDAKGATLSGQVLSMQAASAGGPGLMSASDFSKLAGISGTNTGDQSLNASMRGLTASVTTTDEDAAMSQAVTASNTHGGEIAVFVNGQKQYVGDGTKTADCYFAASGVPGTARAFSAVVATDTLRWVGSVAGFQLAATDKIDVMFMP